MATVCIQCAMRAMLAGVPPPAFDETPEQHLRRVHPDPVAARVERCELERQLYSRSKPDENQT
jgi:hypothetical protein